MAGGIGFNLGGKGLAFNLRLEVAKASFFDRAKVDRAIDAGTKRVLSRFGAYVRQRARTSIKNRKGASKPGTPPHAHIYVTRTSDNPRSAKKGAKRWLFKSSIVFSYDAERKAVVIGPTLLNGSQRNPTVPELLEKGGVIPGDGRTLAITNAVGRDAKGKFVTGGRTFVKVTGSIRYPARPYMLPAFRAELQGKLASQLKGFVGRAA